MKSYFDDASPPAVLMQQEKQGFASTLPIPPAVEFESGLSTCRDLALALSHGPGIVALVGPSGSGKSFVLKAFMRPPPSSAQRAAMRTIDQHLHKDITLDLIDDVDAAGIATLSKAPNTIRRVIAIVPDALSLFQRYFPTSPVVHMRPLASADLRVLLDARRRLLGLPIGSITTRAALLLEKRCAGSPRTFDQLFMQTASEARSSPRIAAEHVERAYEFLQSQSREPDDTQAARQPACTQDFGQAAVAFVAAPLVKMAFATPSSIRALNPRPSSLAAEAMHLLAHDPVASQDAIATRPVARLTSTAIRHRESSLALLSRPQTAEEAAKVSRSRRRYFVSYGLKLAGPALLTVAFVAVPSVVDMRQAIHSSMASLSRMVAGLDDQSQVATGSPATGSNTMGGSKHPSPPEAQLPPEPALPPAQPPPTAQDTVDLPESASQPTLLASPSPVSAGATAEDQGRATTAAGVVPFEDGVGQQQTGRIEEGSRLLTLGKALLAIGQRADAAEMLKTSADLGNLEAASVLDDFHTSGP